MNAHDPSRACYKITNSRRVVPGPDGQRLEDPTLALAAIDATMRPNSERAKIVCLYAPATRAVDVITEEAIDAAIRDLANEIIEFEAFSVLP